MVIAKSDELAHLNWLGTLVEILNTTFIYDIPRNIHAFHKHKYTMSLF